MPVGNLQNDRSQRAALESLLDGTSSSLAAKQDATLADGWAGTGSVARSVEDELRSLGTPVERFGVVADGTTDDTDAWQEALDSGEPLLLPDRASKLSALLEVTEPHTRIYGRHRRQSRLVSSYQFIFKIREGADDFQIFDVGLESTKSASAMQYYGLIHVNNESIDGVHIERCYFTAPDCNTNAFGVYADKEDGTNLVQNIKFLHNIVESTGGGICFQNHLHDTPAWRIKNFWIVQNLFKSIGPINTDYGMGVTLTGRVANGWVVDNMLDDVLDIGLEMANGNHNVHFIRNGFRNITRRGTPLGATHPIACSSNQTPKITHTACSVVGNYSEAGATVEGGLFFGNMDDLVLDSNYFDLEDAVSIRDCNDLRGDKNTFRCQAAKPMVFEGTSGASCKRNKLRRTRLDATSRGSAVTAMVSWEGTAGSCDDNWLIDSLVQRPASGGSYGTTNDAANTRNGFQRTSTDAENFGDRQKTIGLPADADYGVALIDAQYDILRFTGTLTAARTITMPREWRGTIHNNTTGGYGLSIGPSGGTGQTVTNGAKRLIQCRTGDTNDYTVTPFARGQITWSGGGASLTTTVAGVAATDYVIASIHTEPTQAATISRAVCNTNQVILKLTAANTSNDAVIDYIVIRP